MNVKSLLTLLAFSGLAASCSNSELGEPGDRPTDGRSEIQIAFSGTGESQEYTRAIASESENKIEQLHVYLFAAADQAGPFYYLETWTEGTDYNPANPTTTNFKIQDAGTSKKGILYPNELKGLPWIKLLCVANNGTTPKFYDETGAEILNPLTKVTTNADGTINVSGTTEAAFKAAFTNNDADATLIETPLLMTGEGITKISGVSKVDINLKRVMSRFDIVNDKAKTNLTIQDIYMVQGRKSAPLWGATATPVNAGNLATDVNYLTKYANVDFDGIPGANTGETASAFYVYPNLDTDESYLVVKGTYKSPATGNQEPVEYHVDIARTPDGAPKAEFIKLLANNRYKLRISDVTSSNIMGTFEVVDWVSGGGITIKPNNDAPVFVAADAFTGANAPTELIALNTEASPYNYEVTGADGTGSFTIEIGATGKVRAEKDAVQTVTVTRGDVVVTPQDWLVISEPTCTEREGVWYTKFDISYTDAVGVLPVAVHFINDAASYDPALWTTVNFYGQKGTPVFAAAASGTGSKGNTINVTDDKAPAATIFTLKNGYVLFDVTCIEGVTVGITATGYKAEEIAVNGFVHTYKVSVSDADAAEGGTIAFKNAGDATKATILTLTAADPKMTFEKSTDANNAATWDEASSTLKIDLTALADGTCDFKVKAPAGVTIASLACPWLKITESKAWDNTDKFATYTISKASSITGTGDVALSFVNGLTEANKDIAAPELKVTLHKEAGKPGLSAGATVASWSTFNKGLDKDFSDAAASTITMYKVDNSQITVNMTCAEAAEFTSVTGLEIKKIGDTDEYTIKVTTAASLTNATTVVTAKNSSAADRTATLTITWKDPAITVALTDDASGSVVASDEGGSIVYTVDADAITTTPFIFTVTAPGGATTVFTTAFTNQFLAPDDGNAGGDTVVAGTPSAYTLKLSDAGKTDDITLVFTNTVTGGGDKTVILRSNKKP
ncbi:hypothetical protein [Bacteroides oleiciplenus]|uniref:Major fimbrial subunit protein N-terminal domain-containing protein n=1 Tax=Bacteroides oleiciplenus YIT 12058 TaxID=742727 RepID=K9DXQ4_9BACE|nr:hypothetical protein [Bacteroides oleiciplenus]EKU88041.1 hypothetical protein HMPREF9447_04787 [Bacteroides oleiciplenus YIT 12058]